MRRWAIVVVLAGCRQLFGIEPVTGDSAGQTGDGRLGDARTDSSQMMLADAPNGCYGAGAFALCLTFTPQNAVVIGATISTEPGSLDCQTTPPDWIAHGQPDACFIIGMTIGAPSTVTTVSGRRPLVLLATGDITLGGTLDVSSRAMSNGPGANTGTCGGGTAPTAGMRGAGAGGSFTTAGGNGGGAPNGGGTPSPAAGDTAILHGGCAGQAGDDATAAGASGASGGAVYVVSRDGTIHVNATIDASGAGGHGGDGQGGGGGGGGSGGMIVLIAPHVAFASMTTIYADGGGGGGGGSGGGPGGDGASPSDSPASGSGASFIVAGGSGAYDTTPAADGTASMFGGFGGGAGGGGEGSIVLHGTITGTPRVSPPAH